MKNLGQMMKQAQEMQSKMQAMQEELAEAQLEGQAGGGMVSVTMDGKGFGGGEATRDPEPTEIDPNDPKGKQQAIHKAESFAEYLARRKAEGGGEIGSAK